MVVICPKCKTKLKVDDNKLSPQGTRFKCPKCSTILVVKKPAAQPRKPLDHNKVVVAHANPEMQKQISSLLSGEGLKVITSSDGIDAMVKCLNELPALALAEVVLPKIYGFELCKRLKSRPEMKDLKFILISSVHDKNKYRREPSSLHGADDHIEDHEIASSLVGKVNELLGRKGREPEAPAERGPEPRPAPPPKPEPVSRPVVTEIPSPVADKSFDEKVEKARRLSRTIINDINLYNTAKVDASIKNNSFYAVFENELNEGKKLYESRIPAEVRSKGDYFNEAIENFIAAKKSSLGAKF